MSPPTGTSQKRRPQSGTVSVPFVRLYQEGEFVRSYRLELPITMVGRDPGVDIFVDDRFVSRRHFQIERQGENVLYIQDLGSRNGTWVNGERVLRGPLTDGDRVALGPFELTIAIPGADLPSKVIPFPVIKTAPGIELARIEKRAGKRGIREETRILEPIVRLLLMASVVIGLAAFSAWRVYRWTSQRSVPMRSAVVPRIVPTIAPRVEVSRPTPIAPPAIRPPTVVPTSAGKVWVESLDKSLGGIKGPDLRAADRLLPEAAPVRPVIEARRSQAMREAGRKVFAVEITMPSIEPPASTGVSLSPSVKSARAYDQGKYGSMLRSRIQGIEGCYAENAPKAGVTGIVAVWFSISSDGTIGKRGIDRTTIPNAALTNCILDRISKMKVDPPPWDGFTVTYTFRFGTRRVNF
ncbi:MAG: FHA domain-containing protein [Pseudomonadota bacterium]